jgi:hypothetical protein
MNANSRSGMAIFSGRKRSCSIIEHAERIEQAKGWP